MTAMKTANSKGTRIAEASRIPAMMITMAAITMAPRAVACCWFPVAHGCFSWMQNRGHPLVQSDLLQVRSRLGPRPGIPRGTFRAMIDSARYSSSLAGLKRR